MKKPLHPALRTVLAGFALVALSGCGQMSDDAYGAYVDGESYFVVNHEAQKIYFSRSGNPGPDELLKEIEGGKGIGFKTWRDETSCGLTDSAGNSFAIPRHSDSLTRGNLVFTVTKLPAIFNRSNGNSPHSTVVTVHTAKGIPYSYLYDDTVGVRYIDRSNRDGGRDRRIFLEQGVGLLSHCRGFSLKDYSWYNKLNRG